MSQFKMNCPNCKRAITVPETARGKKIKCKSCEEIFRVPEEEDDDDAPAKPVKAKVKAKPVEADDAPAEPKPIPAEFQKPTTAKAKPVQAKPVQATPAEPEPPKSHPAPLGFADDDDDDGPAKAIGVIKEEEVARCPHCAKELDPPDTKICLNCGYDMYQRKRHQSKTVYEDTTEDYFMWWLPAIIWIFVMLLVLGIEIWCIFKMKSIVNNNFDFLVKDEKVEATGEAQYYLSPNACTTCWGVITLFVCIAGVRFCYKRLVKQWKPPEVEKKKPGE